MYFRIIFCLFFTNFTFSQNEICGTTHYVNKSLSDHPEKQHILNDLNNFTKEFRDGISNSEIIDPFTKKTFLERKKESFAGYPALLSAHVTRSPIKQRLLLFSRIALQGERVDELEKIIADIRASTDYNYHWIGLMSGSGFSPEMIDHVEHFDIQGVGLGLIDAVTKRLTVNKDTEEGRHLNQMFLSECIS